VKLLLFTSAVLVASFAGCRKENRHAASPPADPVDSTVGTYIGVMHIHTESSFHGSAVYTTDSSYADTFVLVKISADTFHTGGLFTNGSNYLRFDSSGIYPFYEAGITDTLKVITSRDSIQYYYYTVALYDGGSSGFFSTTRTFSGRR
jgi:hypothetical protein